MRRLLLCLIAAASSCQREPAETILPPVQVHCVHPHRGEIADIVSVRGRLEPPPGGVLLLASQVPGRVVRLLAHEGQRTTLGQVIAVIDDSAARDALRQANAAVAQANAAVANADALLSRTRALVERGIAARQELEDAQAKAESAHASAVASNAAADLAKRTLGRVQVRSTLAGLVTRVLRGAGALVDGTAATPILELAGSSTLEFAGVLTQLDLARVHVEQKATGNLIGSDERLVGFVRAVPSAIDASTGLGTVRIALDAGRTARTVGAYGQMQIVVQHRHDALLVPVGALRGAITDGPEVVVCNDGVAHTRSFAAGVYDGAAVEISAGLEESELVAVDHVLGLSDGARIRQLP